MSNQNPLDTDRKAKADAYTKAKDTLRRIIADAPPYNSVKLSKEEERMMYDHPERFLPGGTGSQGQGRQAAKGGPPGQGDAVKYKKWLEEMNGL
jgi:hypothetical protein